MNRFRQLLSSAVCAAALLSGSAAVAAETIISEWSSIKAPPAPELKPVTVDAKTTALLMLDFVTQTCNEKIRPRCLTTLPAAKQLLADARAHNLLVVYSIVAGGKIGDTLPEVAPTGKEPVVQSGPNKFLNTDLEKILKDAGIKTVIVAGTAAHGAVLHTSADAVYRGLAAVVPVDTMSGDNAYVEQYVTYDFTSAPRLSTATTLTSVGLLKY